MFEKRRLLVWGKTYPEFSTKYYETVCTGAADVETGKLIRIYPITLRYLHDPLATYDLIDAEIERNTSDFRPESHRINIASIVRVDHIDTKKDGWLERSKLILTAGSLFKSVNALREKQAQDRTSLGLVAPKTIKRFYMNVKPDAERKEWEEHRERAMRQEELFPDPDAIERTRKDLNYMPIQYRVEFLCDDPLCPIMHDCAILDWGVYALSRKQYAIKGPSGAQEDVIAQLNKLCDATKTKPHFFMGNTKPHPTSFSVVGLFHPKLAQYEKFLKIRDDQTGPAPT